MAEFENDGQILKRRFKRVFQEIDLFREKIYKKDGLIFITHKHTQEELLESDQYAKIFSITEKIGDDAKNWYDNGNLSEKNKDLYHLYRNEVDDDIHQVHKEIANREPTWWEKVKNEAEKVAKYIMKNLPILMRIPLPAPIKEFLLKFESKANEAIKKLAFKG